jgi:CopG family nickel-responsive transcriptional regulator
LVYDSLKNDIITNLLNIQQAHPQLILSTQRFFKEKNVCLEIIAVEGTSQQLTKLSDELISLKGVVHGKLIMSRVD